MRFTFAILIFGWGVAHALSAPGGLVHHWNFDEGRDWHDSPYRAVVDVPVALDAVGSASASFRNMQPTNRVSGRQFSGLYFDGQKNSLLVSTNLAAAALGGTASLSCWVLTRQSGALTPATAPGITGIRTQSGIQWGWINAEGRIGLAVDDAAVAISASPINDGLWHHVVLTRDSVSGVCQVYVDGRLAGSGTGAAGIRSAAFQTLGGIENGGLYQGKLDQVHIFNRVIDPADVAQLRDNHAPKAWESLTYGTSAAAFTTESIIYKAYDPEQHPLTVTRFTNPAHGHATYNGDGTFTYTPTRIGTDQWTATLADGHGGFATALVRVYVQAPPPAGSENRTVTFASLTPLQAGGSTITLSGWRCPRVLDWDKDGDMDLLLSHSGAIWRYDNLGTATAPLFAPGVRVRANNVEISLSGSTLIALADMTGDAVPDLVAVDNSRKMRVFRNMAPVSAVPVWAAAVIVKDLAGADYLLPDPRFDIADWNADGLPDVITGAWSGEVRVHYNVGTASAPRFSAAHTGTLENGSYNLYPRIFDLNRNGLLDYIRGVNWGNVDYYLDCPPSGGLGSRSGSLGFTGSAGATPDIKALTDGAIIDFADLNGDGVYDAVLGGHAGSSVYLAWGVRKTVRESLAQIGAIYDAYPTNLGIMLETNSQALLKQVRDAENNIINHMFSASLPERRQMWQDMAAHVSSYSFLKLGAPLNISLYHHLPSIAGQNLLTMHQMLPDSPSHRTNTANAVGLTGTARDIYLRFGLHVGDNQKGTRGQLEAVRDLMSWVPRVIFPDTMITLDHYYNDGRGGHVNSFTSAKNTFNWGEGSDVSEWAGDLNSAITAFYGSPVNRGDYFTFVMGHEVTHSLDGYVNSRANKDLRRRWGWVLSHAAGPDVVAGTNGWIDWSATKQSFQSKGYWNGSSASWTPAWSNYWAIGPGKAFEDLSFMRGNINWFLDAPQESLATQANHHHAHSEARLIGAIDRFRRARETGNEPLKANINEVVHFLDFQSAGLNKVVLYDTIGTNSPYQRALFVIDQAWLERDDDGLICRISTAQRTYTVTPDHRGIYTNVSTTLAAARDDTSWTHPSQPREIDVLQNDSLLEGGSVSLAAFTQPAAGAAHTNSYGNIIYTPRQGFVGSDSFAYSLKEGPSATARIHVADPSRGPILVQLWSNLPGSSLSDLLNSSAYPSSPGQVYYTNGAFELPANRADNYASRMISLLRVPATGSYFFYIASDDDSQLWLGTDGSAASKRIVAHVTGWTAPREWTRFASQKSEVIDLIAGQTCYAEVLHKEGAGLDHLAVGWQGPGIPLQVIPGAHLRPPYPAAPVHELSTRQDGVARISLFFLPRSPVRLLASQDLLDWSEIARALTDASGRLVYADLEATNYRSRFYRLE